eukprot:1137966-Pelagomonas_calceolata.AAC.1
MQKAGNLGPQIAPSGNIPRGVFRDLCALRLFLKLCLQLASIATRNELCRPLLRASQQRPRLYSLACWVRATNVIDAIHVAAYAAVGGVRSS